MRLQFVILPWRRLPGVPASWAPISCDPAPGVHASGRGGPSAIADSEKILFPATATYRFVVCFIHAAVLFGVRRAAIIQQYRGSFEQHVYLNKQRIPRINHLLCRKPALVDPGQRIRNPPGDRERGSHKAASPAGLNLNIMGGDLSGLRGPRNQVVRFVHVPKIGHDRGKPRPATLPALGGYRSQGGECPSWSVVSCRAPLGWALTAGEIPSRGIGDRTLRLRLWLAGSFDPSQRGDFEMREDAIGTKI